VGPVQGQVSPKGAGGQGGLGSSRFLAGFRSAALAGAAGARRSAARARAKSRLRSFLVLGRTSSTQCGYFLLFPMREEPRGYRSSQRLRPADRVWRPLPCPCPCPCVANVAAACSLSTELSPIGGKNRCTRRPTWPLHGGIWHLGAKLWTLAVGHHRLRRSPPHMAVPASAVGFVFSGALINAQSLESVAFSFSWHPGATGW
jgi:hypothetical protein